MLVTRGGATVCTPGGATTCCRPPDDDQEERRQRMVSRLRAVLRLTLSDDGRDVTTGNT